MKKLLIKLLRGERLIEEERLYVTILNLLDKYFNKELKNMQDKIKKLIELCGIIIIDSTVEV